VAWNNTMANMYDQCMQIGSSRCLSVYYEHLVLHPERTMRDILTFLDLAWDISVLHHEETINKPGGVSLSS